MYDFDTVYERKDSEKWMEQMRKFGADGLVSLWEADMDFKTAPPIIEAVTEKARQGIYGYVHKSPSYNEAICVWVKKKHGWEIEPSWISHTPMLMTAVLEYLREFTEPGEKMVYHTPVYYPFYDVVPNAGREAIFSPMTYNGSRYEIDFEDLEEKFKTKGVKVYALLNPHNPGGTIWSKDELIRLGNLCLKYGISVISDEAHSDLALGGREFVPFASICKEFADITMTLHSPGKTFNLAGTHQAVIIISNEAVRKRFDKRIGMMDIEKNNCFSLVAVEAGYRHGEDWLKHAMAYIESNMDYVVDFCKNRIPEIKAVKPEGTYLMWLDCWELFTDGKALGEFMVGKAKVGFAEGYWFGEGAAGFERLNAACPRKTLEKAMEQIEKAVIELRKERSGA